MASGVTPATYGSSTHAPQVTVDTYGRVTAASTNPLPTLSSSTLTVAGGPAYTANLPTTAVTAGSYGSARQFTNFTVDAYGRLTAASTTPTGNNVNLGVDAGLTTQGDQNVAIGYNAGKTTQSDLAVAIGYLAGTTTQGEGAVAIGWSAGNNTQGESSVAIGLNAGDDLQGIQSVAIGHEAGTTNQADKAIAIGGAGPGGSGQGVGAIAIGWNAANLNQPANSVAIGNNCAVPGAVGRLAFGAGMEAVATTATAGVNGAPPAQVAGYIKVQWNGTLYKLPAYLD